MQMVCEFVNWFCTDDQLKKSIPLIGTEIHFYHEGKFRTAWMSALTQKMIAKTDMLCNDLSL